jgi:hypothetical protein
MAAALAARGVSSGSSGGGDGSGGGGRIALVDIAGDARRTFVGEPLFWRLFGGGAGGHGLGRSCPVGSTSGGGGCGASGGVAPTPWPLVRVLAAMAELSSLPRSGAGAGAEASPQAPNAPRPWPAVPGYVPGLNALGGLLLVALPECDAFFALHRLLAHQLPAYYATAAAAATKSADGAASAAAKAPSALLGAHRGCSLVDACLAVLDPPLHAHLNAARSPSSGDSGDSGVGRGAYALPLLLSLCAARRPLSQVVKLWDALLALGPAFGVPIAAAQVREGGALF